MGKPAPPYVKIVQGPTESYSLFLDRLREAIERSPNLTPDAKERPSEGRDETSASTRSPGCLDRLTGATRGSAGVDLATATDVTLQDDKVQVISTTVDGPLGHGLSALLIGRSSTSKQGLFVLPGLIDADYTGNIGIMIRALYPPVNIAAGTRIAQLIPFKGCVPKTAAVQRGPHGFGSTGSAQVAFAMELNSQRMKN
uniref:dUTPase-like domain-containing protein n=1 Tax=Pelusios castaneus TaxID=367368 RepID=A0A8C8RXB5_9SAUR